MFKRRISGFCGVVCLMGAALSFAPSPAFAHTGHGAASGLVHGFVHPVAGLDHLLAMVLVGMLAFQSGGRALYALPLSFVVLMAAGGALGMAGIDIPFVETGIALSIIVFGLALAFRAKAPVFAGVALTGLFAVFHGHAHGAEMPADASGFAYGAGFILATALLHAAGLGIGFALGRIGAAVLRFAGAAAAACGFAIVVGLV
jgi:urease accessory protein